MRILKHTTTRFPALSSHTANWRIVLPPFAAFSYGWCGSLEEFLSAVREKTILLEQAPLASLVDQYLQCLETLGWEGASEFLPMVSALIDWKTRLLLPSDPTLRARELDPRQEIMRVLEAGEQRRRELADTRDLAQREGPVGLSLLDLLLLLHELQHTAVTPLPHFVSALDITVSDQIRWLMRWFSDKERDELTSLFNQHPSPSAQLSLFLGLLELAKRGELLLDQSKTFGPCWARRACVDPSFIQETP